MAVRKVLIQETSGQLDTPIGQPIFKEKLFVKLLQENQGIIWKIVRRHGTGTLADQQDLFQDVVLRVWIGFPKFRGEARFGSWVYNIALNTVTTQQQKKSLVSQTFDKIPERFHPLSREQTSTIEDLLASLRNIEEVDRTIFFMLADKYSYDEISTVTGLSVNAITKRIGKLRPKLKDQIEI